jgi:hypothetical protein
MEQNWKMDQLQPGTYRHYKGGLYDVVGAARHSETEEPLAVYRSADGGLWVRPLGMFLETVIVDGVQLSRFALLRDDGLPES